MSKIPQDLIFISAQPDVPYFHWQCQVYVNNFLRLGIPKENIFILFAYSNNSNGLSQGALDLKSLTPNVLGYQDNRERKHYIPSIKPYLVYRFLHENPQYGKQFFLHDSDIIFNFLPDISSIVDDSIQYMSDTTGYLNFEYIMDCDRRYKNNHSSLENGMLLREMVDVVGVEPSQVKKFTKDSGGAQYLLKNQTWWMWYKIYKDSTLLFDKMKRFHAKYPIDKGEIQFWTAEMWSILWNLWWWGQTTKVTDLLRFCWATDTIDKCNDHPILHMAGITDDLKYKHFYKGDFIEKNPLEILKKQSNYFSFIEPDSATSKYIDEMKKMVL